MALSNKKLELACNEYLINRNWSQAMIKAGYKESTAKTSGSKYFAYPEVQARIFELDGLRMERLERDSDDVIEELENLAYSNIMDLFEYASTTNKRGEQVAFLELKDLSNLPRHITASIKKIKITPPGTFGPGKTEVEFHNKSHALEMLGRHFQLFDKGSGKGVDYILDMDLGDDPDDE